MSKPVKDSKKPFMERWEELVDVTHCEAAPDLPSPTPPNCAPSVLDNDIARCLWHSLPQIKSRTEDDIRSEQRGRLREVVIRSLVDTPHHYYQGLHELLGVITLTAPEGDITQLATLTRRVVDRCLGPFCTRNMEQTEGYLHALHHVLVEETDHGNLTRLLEATGVAPDSHYALSWMVTWFAHVIDDIPKLQLIFTYLLETHCPTGIIFVCAALILLQEREIIARIFSEKDSWTSDDFGIVYAKMSSIPKWKAEPDGLGISSASTGELFSPVEVIRLAESLRLRWGNSAQRKIQDYLHEREEESLRQMTHPAARIDDSVLDVESTETSKPNRPVVALGAIVVALYSASFWYMDASLR